MNRSLKSFSDTFIIFDTEYTSWKDSIEKNWSSQNQYRELIQIGALKINKVNTINKENKINTTIKIVDEFNIYIKPIINPKLSFYFKNLTKITQNFIEKNGIKFKDAINLFYDFCKDKNGNNYNIYSYGNEFNIIKENLKLNNIKNQKLYKWENHFFDIKPLFNFVKDIDKYTSGTLYTAFKLKPKENINIHNSLWDSKSLFLSLKHII